MSGKFDALIEVLQTTLRNSTNEDKPTSENVLSSNSLSRINSVKSSQSDTNVHISNNKHHDEEYSKTPSYLWINQNISAGSHISVSPVTKNNENEIQVVNQPYSKVNVLNKDESRESKLYSDDNIHSKDPIKSIPSHKRRSRSSVRKTQSIKSVSVSSNDNKNNNITTKTETINTISNIYLDKNMNNEIKIQNEKNQNDLTTKVVRNTKNSIQTIDYHDSIHDMYMKESIINPYILNNTKIKPENVNMNPYLQYYNNNEEQNSTLKIQFENCSKNSQENNPLYYDIHQNIRYNTHIPVNTEMNSLTPISSLSHDTVTTVTTATTVTTPSSSESIMDTSNDNKIYINDDKTNISMSQSIDSLSSSSERKRNNGENKESASEKRHRCWSPSADDRLKRAVTLYGEKQWKEIAQYVGDKSYVQCAQRWRNVLKSGIKKGHWSAEEDDLLRKAYKETEGLRDSKRWTAVSEHVPGKTNKQCRERWNEHLRPEINKGVWTAQEDALLLSLYTQLGSQWSKIANHMCGRTQNNVKSRWKTLNRKDVSQRYVNQAMHSISPIPTTYSTEFEVK